MEGIGAVENGDLWKMPEGRGERHQIISRR